jgi:hypothetical protein
VQHRPSRRPYDDPRQQRARRPSTASTTSRRRPASAPSARGSPRRSTPSSSSSRRASAAASPRSSASTVSHRTATCGSRRFTRGGRVAQGGPSPSGREHHSGPGPRWSVGWAAPRATPEGLF